MLGVLRGFLRGAKRGPLSPKQGNKNFYKGYGAKSAGRLTSKGKFVIQEHKIPVFVAPDLEGFELKPYVSRQVDPKNAKTAPLTADDIREALKNQ